MERWPENAPGWQVQLGLLGDVILGPAEPGVAADSVPADGLHLYYPETGHSVGPPFKEFFDRRGGLPIFGYPTSEATSRDGWLKQRFQRAQLEWWPENPGPYRVQPTLLGDAYVFDRSLVPHELTEPVPPLPGASTAERESAMGDVASDAIADPEGLFIPAARLDALRTESVDALWEQPGQVRQLGDTVDVLVVGDLMLGRSVQAKVRQYGGDPTRPFWKVAEHLRQADLTVGNLECALTDSFDQPYDPLTFSLVARTNAADGLAYAGVDAVSLANNHTTEFGPAVLTETMAALRQRGVTPFGAGASLTDAHKPAVFDVRGLRIALLGYDDVYVGGEATATRAGLARAREDEIRSDVAAARGLADVVIPYFHWGEEYTPNPNERQRHLARVAVDAGATVVVGTHAHWGQAMEVYHDRPICYGLGNFVWDMMHEPEARQLPAVHLLFKDGRLAAVRILAALTEDYHQPRFLGRAEAYPLLDRMLLASRRLGTSP
jgi:poly-gamma-glutamate synthesis protein (capsule biosynthesis protein)